MATQRIPPGGDPKKGTSRHAKPVTGGHKRPGEATRGAARIPAPKKNNTPLIIGGAAGGGLLLIVIIAVVASGGKGPVKSGGGKTDEPKPTATQQENEGREFCTKGKNDLDSALSAAASTSRNDARVEAHKRACDALARLKKGLDAYADAARITKEKYPVAGYEQALTDATAKLESGARTLCAQGQKVVDTESPSLAVAKDAQKEKIMKLVEEGLKDLREGVDSYTRLAEATGKSFPIETVKRAFEAGVDRYAKGLEAEADRSIKEGLAVIQSTEEMMTKGFSEAEKPVLRDKLEKGIHLISHGNNLRDRIYQVSGRQYEDSVANKAFKAAKMKLLELK